MEKTVYDFIEDEDANSAIEFALVIVLVIATTTLVTTGFKEQLTGMVSSIGTRLNSAVNTISWAGDAQEWIDI